MEDTFSDIFMDQNLSEKQIYDITWSGKHISAGYFLRKAVRSSLRHAIIASAKYLEHCQKAKKKCNCLAERVLVADMNYSGLLPGPLLSVIIFSASSVEAFTRHCFISTMKITSRRCGQHAFHEKIVEFERTPSIDRILMLVSILKAKDLPNQLKKEIGNLISFRNDVMHSDPIYLSEYSATQTKVSKNKSVYEKEPRQYDGNYPDLTAGTRPLHLMHALFSTITHDKLIEHLLNSASSADGMEFFGEIEMTGMDNNRIWGHPIESMDYDQAYLVAKEMIAVNREFESVTIKEQRDFMKKLNGKKSMNSTFDNGIG